MPSELAILLLRTQQQEFVLCSRNDVVDFVNRSHVPCHIQLESIGSLRDVNYGMHEYV